MAGDGARVLVQVEVPLPWDGTVAFRPPPPLVGRALLCSRRVVLGRTGTHVMLRVGPWTFALEIVEAQSPAPG
jgi:hypothetical protein